MAETKLFVGPRVRRIRTNLELTQTDMAARLGISPSYLNLIERNQRPLTAQLVLKLVSVFKIDVEELQPTGEAGSVPALKEVFSDPLLSGELPGDSELLELSDGAPNAAIGIVKLYRAYKEQQERLKDLSQLMAEQGHSIDARTKQLPAEQVTHAFERASWTFPALERAAERIAKDIGDLPDRFSAMSNFLRAEHGISVQVLPVETMPNWRRRYDRHSQRLFVSERLTPPERALLLAQELVLLREEKLVLEEVELLNLEGDEASRLARFELARYAGLAILMPYDRMLRVSERLAYDFPVLERRFGVNFSQLAQRLVALQDKSAGKRAGLPFFMMEFDQAGNIVRRLGARGFPVSTFGGNCPKLSVHTAFSSAGAFTSERVISPEGVVYFTISAVVAGPQIDTGSRPQFSAVLLGIEDKYASALLRTASDKKPRNAAYVQEQADVLARHIVHARLLADPVANPPVAIGPSCRLCARQDCIARIAPQITHPLGLDELVQGFGSFGLT